MSGITKPGHVEIKTHYFYPTSPSDQVCPFVAPDRVLLDEPTRGEVNRVYVMHPCVRERCPLWAGDHCRMGHALPAKLEVLAPAPDGQTKSS